MVKMIHNLVSCILCIVKWYLVYSGKDENIEDNTVAKTVVPTYLSCGVAERILYT